MTDPRYTTIAHHSPAHDTLGRPAPGAHLATARHAPPATYSPRAAAIICAHCLRPTPGYHTRGRTRYYKCVHCGHNGKVVRVD